MHQGPPMNNMAVGVAGGIQGSGVQGINHVGPGVQSNMANAQGHHLHGVLSNEDERKVTLMNNTLQFSITISSYLHEEKLSDFFPIHYILGCEWVLPFIGKVEAII